jgi:hypothetical protein
METLKEVVIELLLKNKELNKKVEEQRESLSFWYKKYDEVEQELNTLKEGNNE